MMLSATAIIAAGCATAPGPERADTIPVPGGTPGGDATPSFRRATTSARIAECTVHPPDHFLNAVGVDKLPVHPKSSTWLSSIGGKDAVLKFPTTDIWAGSRGGMPINVVDSDVTGFQHVTMNPWGSTKSFLGPYPIPEDPKVSGHPTPAWDRRLLIVDVADCMAYELIQYDYYLAKLTGAHVALSGTRYPLNTTDWPTLTTNAPQTPVIGQLALQSEVAAGEIPHVLGFCSDSISTSHVWPARRSDGKVASADAMPMGTWIRLKSTAKTAGFGPSARAVVTALRERGAVLTDTCGHDFYLQAENSAAWDDADLKALRSLSASDFEVVDTTSMRVHPKSFAIR